MNPSSNQDQATVTNSPAILAPVTLSLDTSSRRTTLALLRGTDVLQSRESAGDDRRSESLWLDVDDLLLAAGMRIDDVDLFGVCVGPGGFTGLRVGVAAAKGFAAATGNPIVGVTSLEAAAWGAPGGPACSMVGAYKGEVYWQLFEFDDEGVPVALSAAYVSTSSDAAKQLAALPDVIFVGDAAEPEMANIREVAGERFRDNSADHVDGWCIKRGAGRLAESVAQIARVKMRRGLLETPESVHAVYVRPAEAEVKLSLGQLGSKIKRTLGY